MTEILKYLERGKAFANAKNTLTFQIPVRNSNKEIGPNDGLYLRKNYQTSSGFTYFMRAGLG